MRREFWHKGSTFVFLDIDPNCKRFEDENVHIQIGNQADQKFLLEVSKKYGPFDVIIDDSGHINEDQITSFLTLWPQLSDPGLYLVEDTHSSYWPGFGGGYKKQNSFMSMATYFVDQMHSWYTEDEKNFPFNPIAEKLSSVKFYDSIVAFQKKSSPKPASIVSINGQTELSYCTVETRGRLSTFPAAKTPNQINKE